MTHIIDNTTKGQLVFLILDVGARQIVLEDHMGPGEDFAAYADRQTAQAKEHGYIQTQAAPDLVTTTFVGSGMALTFMTKDRMESMQARQGMIAMPPGRRV